MIRLHAKFFILALIAPVVCSASSLYLYTINFDATAGSAATSVSYLSEGIASDGQIVPGQETVLSLPGVGATQHLGTNYASVTTSFVSAVFDLGGSIHWIFTASTDTITGVGTYLFTSGELSGTAGPHAVTGDVVVQQLATPPVIYRYTETWNATADSAATSFSYDSPVFLGGNTPVSGSDINPISVPGPNAQPSPALVYLVGNSLQEGYFADSNGNNWLMRASVPTFYFPGTYDFVTADVLKTATGGAQTDLAATGSVSVAVIAPTTTPEPGGLALVGLSGLFFAGLAVRARVRA